jgi:hypothetical protein
MNMPSLFIPEAAPQVIENTYTENQATRILDVIRTQGPWPLILAQHFKTPEEVVATIVGFPKDIKPTWDMFLNPVFRGFFANNGVCFYPELDDCFYNKKFLDLVRGYWSVPYAQPESFLFNIQGPTWSGNSPHVDGTHFRGLYSHNCPIWLLNTMAKSGLFTHWQAKKAQVIAWYYKGTIGGGFHYWAHGAQKPPTLLPAPMWGRGVVVENEMMYHMVQGCGPVAQRRPEGMAINTVMSPDPKTPGGWQITTDGKVNQQVPNEEFRLLVHWSAQLFSDLSELKCVFDQSDDITVDRVFDIFIKDLHARNVVFQMPTDPLSDTGFMATLTGVYDSGPLCGVPPDPVDGDNDFTKMLSI